MTGKLPFRVNTAVLAHNLNKVSEAASLTPEQAAVLTASALHMIELCVERDAARGSRRNRPPRKAPVRQGAESAAAFVKAQGWRVGDTLRGEPILSDEDGTTLELGRVALITAIGVESVLCKTRRDGETSWGRESLYSFASRGWVLDENV